MKMIFSVSDMTEAYALEISKWVYENEYSVYSFEQNEETIAELLNGDYTACVDANNNLAGYFCQGKSACIPTKECYLYSGDRLDMGLGMHPALCGKGMGYDFIRCGIQHLTQQNPDVRLRLTVACFNKRAISLYEKVGFVVERTVTHKTLGQPFYIMVRQADL